MADMHDYNHVIVTEKIRMNYEYHFGVYGEYLPIHAIISTVA